VGHVIESVSKYATTVSSRGRIPIPKDDSMCKLPERRGKYDEQCRRHDMPVFVHGKVVVNAVKKKM
jgi:hypothetical protein